MPATHATNVSAKLPDDLYAFIEDYRWSNRLTKTQVMIDALTEWAATKGFTAGSEIPSHEFTNEDNDTPPQSGEPT